MKGLLELCLGDSTSQSKQMIILCLTKGQIARGSFENTCHNQLWSMTTIGSAKIWTDLKRKKMKLSRHG